MPKGIPRTRGDGPGLRSDLLALIPDSPHPRGWTRLAPRRQRDRPGFPAPAGMDPVLAALGAAGRRIPRTRGDGPPAACRWAPAIADSPHPRGWTDRPPRRPDTRPGFPAPAGMDLAHGRAGRHDARIPRTRGDGPSCSAGAARGSADSPHPRGWTPGEGDQLPVHPGFPAPAGMDPRPRTRGHTCRRIPRTRGDGPGLNPRSVRDRTDSPHPRGWTLVGPAANAEALGFPAPAGMDPRCSGTSA